MTKTIVKTKTPILKFDNLNVIYNEGQPNQVHALKGVSGKIHEENLFRS